MSLFRKQHNDDNAADYFQLTMIKQSGIGLFIDGVHNTNVMYTRIMSTAQLALFKLL